MTALVFSLVAALGYGVSDFLGGLASRRARAVTVVLVVFPVAMFGLGALLPFVSGRASSSALVVGGICGVLSGLGLLWFYAALAAGPMSVVSPLTALLVAGLPLLAGVLLGERPGPLALVGAALALVAVVLVSREERTAMPAFGPAGDRAAPRPGGDPSVPTPTGGPAALDSDPVPARLTPAALWLTAGSGAAYAAYFVLLDTVPADSGLWPLFASRVVASVLVVLVCAFGRTLRPPTGVTLRLAVGAAILDVVANVAFLYALRAGLLSLVSVLAALYPVATVLLARVFLGERPGAVQRIGLGLAVVAITLIAIGS